MESLAQSLLLWIASHSQYSVDNIPVPTVLFLTPQEITAEYYGHHTELIPHSGIDDRVLALYDATAGDAGIIYLHREVSDWNSTATMKTDSIANTDPLSKVAKSDLQIIKSDPVLMERLLHELVHHVQFQTGEMEKFPCRAYGEKEAYRLGGLFFKKRYIEDPMPNRNFWAHVYSRC